MSGFWPQSFSTVQDLNGIPMVGAKAFFYAGGTTTKITVFQDYGLTTPHPNPITTDGYGRFPAVYLDEDDEFFRVRATTEGGVILYDADQIPIIGPAEGGGGSPPAPVDPNAIFKTGDVKPRYGTGLHVGWVRMNGRTIGTATSGATERANSDCQPLYEYLWNTDPNLVILGGRGGSASADWGSNKPLTLPTFRGRALVGLDDMGNTAAGVLTGVTVLGKTGGAEKVTLTVAQMPNHDHGLTINEAGEHTHPIRRGDQGGGSNAQNGPYTGSSFNTEPAGIHKHTGTISKTGGGQSHDNVQPYLALTLYIRL